MGTGEQSAVDQGDRVYGLRDLVADAVKTARQSLPPMKRFAYLLRKELGWRSLGRQTIYDWESGTTRIPAEVLVAAAAVAGVTVDQLISTACEARSSAGVR